MVLSSAFIVSLIVRCEASLRNISVVSKSFCSDFRQFSFAVICVILLFRERQQPINVNFSNKIGLIAIILSIELLLEFYNKLTS